MYKPYPRQQEAIDKMVAFVGKRSAKKGIFVYPTGFGKSIVIANTAMKFPDKYFINVAPRQELIEQNYNKFISYGYEASLCSASLNSRDVGKITFATIKTLKKYVDFFKDKDVVILADECDEGSKKGSDLHKFMKHIKKCKLMGTTATPLRLGNGEIKMMNRDFYCFYSSIEDVVQISEVIDGNYWSPLKYTVGKVDTRELELNSTGNDYTFDSIKKFSIANKIIERCMKSVKFLQDDGRKSILVFLSSIAEAEELAKIVPNCRALHSKLKQKERKEIVEGFIAGDIDVVAQVNILSVGFDFPQLDGIIFARPTNSIRIWYQGLGRGVRKHEDKEDCKIIDISGNFFKFGKIENITYENTALTDGWACFSGNRLVTGYKLDSPFPPTKQSLLRYIQMSQAQQDYMWKYTLKFGKFKGKTLRQLDKSERGQAYLGWLINEIRKDRFKIRGNKGRELKKVLYMYFKID